MSPVALARRAADSLRQRTRKHGRLTLVIAFACAAVMLMFYEGTFARLVTALADIRGAHAVRAALDHALRELAIAESAQRGFVMTGDKAYLKPYESSRKLINQELELIEPADMEGAEARQLARAFAKTVVQKFSEMDLTIRLREEGKVEAVNFVVTTNVGLDQMAQANTLAQALLGEIDRQVTDRRENIGRLVAIARVGVAAGVFAALLALVLYSRQTRELQRAEEYKHRALEAERDALESQVRERTARLTELATHLQQAVEEERAHLARELHDELGALLTAAKLDVARLRSRLPADATDQLERLKHLTDTLNQGIALKRRIIEDLRPSSLSNLGLVASLEILSREFADRANLEVDVALESVSLAEAGELTIYRVVQEALTNIGKYAQASKVTVSLKNYVYHVEVSVFDDGKGFDATALPQASHGLVGMRHRIEASGGRLDINSAPGRGTRITATIPRAQAMAQQDIQKAGDGMSEKTYNAPAAPLTPANAAG